MRAGVHVRLTAWLAAVAMMSGCATGEYYYQAIAGHLDLMHRSRPIAEWLQDPSTSPDLRARLELVLHLREFASSTLALPNNASYRSYVALNRPAAVWSVVGAAEFSVDPVTWCYPVVGCASYRGYFSQAEAETFAAALQAGGYDVAMDPVPAYSTLGWFNDPLPSTVITWLTPRLAGLIFHELAHQQLYLAGDSAFNEAFATAVEQLGVNLWLQRHGSPQERASWQQARERTREFVEMLLSARNQLAEIYCSEQPVDELRRRKAERLNALMLSYQSWKAARGGFQGYDAWFARGPINNARLASVATYREWVAAFIALFGQLDGNFPALYRAGAELAALAAPERRKRLSFLAAEAQMALRNRK